MNVLPDFPEKLWTVPQVAKLFGTSASWVYKAVERGEIPCVRLGTMVRFDPIAVRRFVEARSVPASSPNP